MTIDYGDQAAQTKVDEERQKIADRDPLIPQPSPSNVSGPAHDPALPEDIHDRSGGEPPTGEQTKPVSAPEPELLEPEVDYPPVVSEPEVTQRDEDTGRVLPEEEQEPSEHEKRVQAGKKAAATRAKNEASALRSAAAKKAAKTRAKKKG